MKFCCAGDIIIGRRIADGYVGYDELSPIINEADAKFFNLETTLNREGECYASEVSGGTYLRTNPEVLDDIKKFGFNMTSFNNNHAMDFSFEGLLLTLDAVNKSGLVHSGVGRNLAEASAPRYLDTKCGRVALISINTTLAGQMMAGEQSERMPGRPGVNAVRYEQVVTLTDDDYESMSGIIGRSGISAELEMDKKAGYFGGDDGKLQLDRVSFVKGDETKLERRLNEKDLARLKKAIYEAKLQADYIMVSVHSHEPEGYHHENVPKFLEEIAHFCIDQGANAVVGHGPHLLRPIEIYKGMPIFYSLGDFVLQLYNVEFAPDEFYSQYGLSTKATIHELLKTRSKDFTVGLMTDRRMFITILPLWETEGETLKRITLYPVLLSMDGKKSEIGLPRLCTDPELLSDFTTRCEALGTRLQRNPDGSYDVVL